MRKQTAYKSLLVSAAVLGVGLVGFLTIGQSTKWVGHTDLEVCFVVTDSDTGQPIPNATIHIRAELRGFCNDPPQPEFTIVTDENGEARQLATNCMCFGAKGTFEDTFASHLPPWSFRTSAAGYSEVDQEYLDVPENASQVQRGDPFATLSIPIRLRRNAAQQHNAPELRVGRLLMDSSLAATRLLWSLSVIQCVDEQCLP